MSSQTLPKAQIAHTAILIFPSMTDQSSSGTTGTSRSNTGSSTTSVSPEKTKGARPSWEEHKSVLNTDMTEKTLYVTSVFGLPERGKPWATNPDDPDEPYYPPEALSKEPEQYGDCQGGTASPGRSFSDHVKVPPSVDISSETGTGDFVKRGPLAR